MHLCISCYDKSLPQKGSGGNLVTRCAHQAKSGTKVALAALALGATRSGHGEWWPLLLNHSGTKDTECPTPPQCLVRIAAHRVPPTIDVTA